MLRNHLKADGNMRNSSKLRVLVDLLGKLWSFPNTLIGLLIGLSGHALSYLGNRIGMYNDRAHITCGNNAIQFHNNALMIFGALTIGNVICYGCHCAEHSHGEHERQHTIQAQVLGPLYIPLHLIAQLASICTHRLEAYRGPTLVHGRANFLETGPLSDPPRPWPFVLK